MDNFLTNVASLNVFSEKILTASYRNQISAAPFVRSLERVHGVSRGLGALFTLLQLNEAQRLTYVDRDEGDTQTPPLPTNTVDCFMALGVSVCQLLEADIERLAKWADARADIEAQQASAPAAPRRVQRNKDSSKEAANV
jgi:hypothetical protein